MRLSVVNKKWMEDKQFDQNNRKFTFKANNSSVTTARRLEEKTGVIAHPYVHKHVGGRWLLTINNQWVLLVATRDQIIGDDVRLKICAYEEDKFKLTVNE